MNQHEPDLRLIKISDMNRGSGKKPTIRQSRKRIIHKNSPNMQVVALLCRDGPSGTPCGERTHPWRYRTESRAPGATLVCSRRLDPISRRRKISNQKSYVFLSVYRESDFC